MAIYSPVRVNTFQSSMSAGVRATGWDYFGAQQISSGSSASRAADQRAVIQFLSENGKSNPPFQTSTTGKITPLHEGSTDPRITRGFIRRTAPDSGDALSTASLNFMFNPEHIIRDYVSYMDQAALDPFNTLYQSGNLVAPPSFVNFSFNLVFDRQIENSTGGGGSPYQHLPEGVLADYRYFDMVVRNVPPVDSSGSTTTPDNGVMMVNPKDITVVFSPELTVQGRPTNARVAFTKFNHLMVPVRMEVALTMIITYFGPLRESFGLDTHQDIRDYEALIPYSQVYAEEYTAAQLEEANRVYNVSNDARIAESASAPKSLPYSTVAYNAAFSSAVQQGGGSAQQSAVINQKIAVSDILANARFRVAASIAKNGKCGYSTEKAIGPDTYSSPGLAYAAFGSFGSLGLNGKFHPKPTIKEIIDFQTQTGWTHLKKIHTFAGTEQISNLTQAKGKIQPGDILLRHSTANDHLAFFVEWIGGDKSQCRILSARGPGRDCGEDIVPLAFLGLYNMAVRPSIVGAQSAGGNFGSGVMSAPSGKTMNNSELRAVWGTRCDVPLSPVNMHGGMTYQVHTRIVDAVKALNAKLIKYNYPSVESGGGGYSCRNIAGTSTPSLHSWGIALDINPTANPYTSPLKTNIPVDLRQEIKNIRTKSNAQVWKWGGDFSGNKDAMHFEIYCSPGDIATGIVG